MLGIRGKLASAVAVLALSGGLVAVPVSTASATSSCLSTLGKAVEAVEPDGDDIGTFYEGWNSCTKVVYAEFHFKSSPNVWNSSSEITIDHSGTDFTTTLQHIQGTGNLWWDTPMVSIYSIPTSDRAYYASFHLDNNGSTICEGGAAWNFSGYQITPTYVSCSNP
ncbi:hypothetical protein [Streptacidiphilus anmyonensis]|uniref:hypothetical protein n=1 Tax=Streptacidiphilus anmyonensis TaxID=405782 RepID=UPI0005A9529D|nr:hypothetical protein [Streptacidiphilus anmyonensis]